MSRLVALVLALLGAGLVLAGGASAHAVLIGSDPASGARLPSAPATVTLRFDDPVTLGGLGFVHVTAADGHRVDTGTPTLPDGGLALRASLTGGLGASTYTVDFRALSDDNHPVAGTLRFVVGTGPLTGSSAAGGHGSGAAALLDVARWITFAGLVLLGGAWLPLTVWGAGRTDARARRVVGSGLAALGAGAVVEVLLQGVLVAGASPLEAFRPSFVDATLHGRYGVLHLIRLALVLALAAVLRPGRRPGARRGTTPFVALALGLGVAVTISAAGHASTTAPVPLSVAIDAAHLAAIATWLGGLAVLAAALFPRHRADELAEVLPRFSRVAMTCVVTIAVTGAYAAWRGAGSWSAFADTGWGRLVVAKVVAFVGLLAAGNLARSVVHARPAVAVGASQGEVEGLVAAKTYGETATEQVRRVVLVELAVGAVVLALAAVLIGRPRGVDLEPTGHAHGSPIVVSGAYVRAAGASAGTATAYFTVRNTTDRPDRLLDVATGAGRTAVLHTAGMSAAGGAVIPAQGQLVLSTGQGHVMITGLFGALTAGQTVNLELRFARGGGGRDRRAGARGRRPGPHRGPVRGAVLSRREAVVRVALLRILLAGLLVVPAACSSSGGSGGGSAVPSGLNDQTGTGTFQGVGLIPPRPRPSFTLTDTSGAGYDFARQTAGRATLLFFGYTHCPDICPATMADVGVALRSVPKDVQQRTTVAFVSTDVRRDTGPVIETWLKNFTPGTSATFVGLRGTQAQVDAAQAAAHITIAEDGGATHSTQVLLYGPDDYAHVSYVYNEDNESQQMAHDLPLVVAGRT